MHYLICDDKLLEPKNIDNKVFFEVSIEKALSKFTEGYFSLKDAKWDIFLHCSNNDFKTHYQSLLVKVKEAQALGDVYLISTTNPQYLVDDYLINQITNITNKLKYIDGFTPEKYMNEEAWKKVIEQGIFDEILFSNEKSEILISIFLMCQCYLIVVAEKCNGKWGPDEISNALLKMEWPEFTNSEYGQSQLNILIINEIKIEVKRTHWWKTIIEIEKNQLLNMISKELKEGNEVPFTIKNLINNIYDQESEFIKSECVANAYIYLANKYER